MKKPVLFFYLISFTCVSLFVYGCSESDPVSPPVNNGNTVPDNPKNPSPADSSTNASRLVILGWTCTDPNTNDTLTYDVYLDDNFPPNLQQAGVTTNSLSVGLVAAQTTFYWKVVAKDNHGGVTAGPYWWFTTGN